MKALSIRQPWAWLIVRPDLTGDARDAARLGGLLKTVENRTWATGLREQIYIHAAKGCTRQAYDDAVDFVSAAFPELHIPPLNQLERGGIIGTARIVGCARHCDGSVWFMGPVGIQLADSEPLPFHACPGRLGFFEVTVP